MEILRAREPGLGANQVEQHARPLCAAGQRCLAREITRRADDQRLSGSVGRLDRETAAHAGADRRRIAELQRRAVDRRAGRCREDLPSNRPAGRRRCDSRCRRNDGRSHGRARITASRDEEREQKYISAHGPCVSCCRRPIHVSTSTHGALARLKLAQSCSTVSASPSLASELTSSPWLQPAIAVA